MPTLPTTDLTGYTIEDWYELTVLTGSLGRTKKIVSYFSVQATAESAASGKNWDGSDGTVRTVKVLTDGSGDGWLVNETYVSDDDADGFLAKEIEEAKAKLTAHEKDILGIV